MAIVKENLLYSKTHEWVEVTGNEAKIGIADFAQEELTDIVYVELVEVGELIEKGSSLGVLESVKAAGEIYSPLSGKITKINEEVIEKPELLNESPYEHWLITIELSDKTELDDLLKAEEYKDLLKNE